MNKQRILFKGATILPMNGESEDLPAGDLLVEGDLIAAIAPDLTIDDAEVIDASGMVLCPGFVDTHRHTWQTPLHGVRTDWNLLDYMTYIRGMYCVCYEPEDAALANWVGALEALDSGITTLVDHSHLQLSQAHSDALAEGIIRSGIRGIFCYGTYRNLTYTPGRNPSELPGLLHEVNGPLNEWHKQNATRVRDEFFADDSARVRFGIASREFETLSEADSMLEELRWSRTLGPARISVHVGMSANEPLNVVRELHNAGKIGPDLLFVHGNHLTDDELRMIIDGGASISSAVEIEMTYGAYPVVNRFTAMGGQSSIGIDATIDFAGDMFGQMRALLNEWRLERSLRNPLRMTRKVHQKKVLELATVCGAEAIGLGDVTGSLAVGKKADLLLLRTDSLGLAPMSDPYAAVVTYGHPSLVDTVMVDGQVVKRHGKLVGIDWPSIRAALERSRAGIRRRFSLIPEQPIRERWAKGFRIEIPD
ncbi:amidohydrolase family protein [Amycolatopsis sp. K13G38]|uniref:Amidohydrolase family protein n=1 Tax=Amycolatopsis acididurans TaxID=2724524 RepID=A0ABX1JGY1_9PSEU|nr:amidohydrolase family protein [Amycolatopsis acididurans]NKQ57811.1 amidohydrolase family protein [Amycolatopsis acididurans]